GQARGVVESVGLRVTRLRDANGAVWYVRNGEILRVANQSQGWGLAVLDVGVPYEHDPEQVRNVLHSVVAGLRQEVDWRDVIVDDPVVGGVGQVSAERVVFRVTVRTQPQRHDHLTRELRLRLKTAFDKSGIPVVIGAGS